MAGGDDSEDPTPEFYSEGAPDAARDTSSSRRVRPGTLLLASTDLLEPTFARTVIYVMEHNDAGSLGVVLNRMSQTAVHNLLPQWSDLAATPRALYVGGPVKQDAALCLGVMKLGADATGYDALRPIDGRVVLVDLDGDPEELSEVLEGVRVFAGYSGWGIGQLDGELEQDSWMLASALARDLLAPTTTDLWAGVLRRQPWPTPLLASHPIDVSRN
ncbi:YqgE/AlgH family protein [Gordonia insulae]|uniref:YqgE/AlgH family protein n=1 Tax=Gordonia insulae TaxID=2420509 RepID=UPI000F5BF3A8|nr:YqgE/AlgH family protein [Gordonia insulae]